MSACCLQSLQDVQGSSNGDSKLAIVHIDRPSRCALPAHLGLAGVLLQLSNAKFVFGDTNMRLKYTRKEAVGTDMASVVVTVDEDYDLMHGPEV